MTEFSADEFAADFREEALAHLQQITRLLLDVERDGVTPESVDGLFRSFHTLKGLCGMVGLERAATLSHEAESLLTRVRRGQHPLSGERVDRLLDAARALQDIIEHREASVLSQVLSQLTEAERAGLGDAVVSLCTFTPTPERAARNVNVASVRERLGQAARIVRAMPLQEGGQVRFAFLLAGHAAPDPTLFPELEWVPVARSEAPRQPTSTAVRVDIPRLDEVMRMVGALMHTRARLELINQEVRDDRLEELVARMSRQLRGMREAVTRLRLVPLGDVLSRLELVVRDVSRERGVQVRLLLEGEEVQVDKLLVERLADPLLHLARNALTHGLETTDVRRAEGKPESGTLSVVARREGESLCVRVEDDGRGIDRQQVTERARGLGLPAPVTTTDLLDLLCRPGFSTRPQADLGAGRGVGLDVVAQAIRALGGRLSLETEPGRMTAFMVKVPLSLVIVDVLLVEVGAEIYAVPRPEVDRVIEIEAVLLVEGGTLVQDGARARPLLRVGDLFGVDGGAPRYGVVSDRGPVLGVDRLLGMQEVVVQTLTDPLVARPGLAGTTELGSGRLVLILDVPALVRDALRGAAA